MGYSVDLHGHRAPECRWRKRDYVYARWWYNETIFLYAWGICKDNKVQKVGFSAATASSQAWKNLNLCRPYAIWITERWWSRASTEGLLMYSFTTTSGLQLHCSESAPLEIIHADSGVLELHLLALVPLANGKLCCRAASWLWRMWSRGDSFDPDRNVMMICIGRGLWNTTSLTNCCHFTSILTSSEAIIAMIRPLQSVIVSTGRIPGRINLLQLCFQTETRTSCTLPALASYHSNMVTGIRRHFGSLVNIFRFHIFHSWINPTNLHRLERSSFAR